VARPVASLDDPVMADFVGGLARLNALADNAPGFVWRLQDDDGDATALRPFGPDLMVNMSVWTSIELLREYVYRSAHLDLLRRRREFFVHAPSEVYTVLWWVPAAHLPTVDEAWQRLETLRTQGPGPDAFTFRAPFPPPGGAVAGPSSVAARSDGRRTRGSVLG
jgi:hypothetical protein